MTTQDLLPGLFTDGKTMYVERCPSCHQENYAPAVASGECAWCGWTATWKGYNKEERIPICSLDDSHVVNIIKYYLSMNRIPPLAIMGEAQRRNFLSEIGQVIPEQKGYIGPREMIDVKNEIIQQKIDELFETNPIDDGKELDE